jgi:hypothetical protein
MLKRLQYFQLGESNKLEISMRDMWREQSPSTPISRWKDTASLISFFFQKKMGIKVFAFLSGLVLAIGLWCMIDATTLNYRDAQRTNTTTEISPWNYGGMIIPVPGFIVATLIPMHNLEHDNEFNVSVVQRNRVILVTCFINLLVAVVYSITIVIRNMAILHHHDQWMQAAIIIFPMSTIISLSLFMTEKIVNHIQAKHNDDPSDDEEFSEEEKCEEKHEPQINHPPINLPPISNEAMILLELRMKRDATFSEYLIQFNQLITDRKAHKDREAEKTKTKVFLALLKKFIADNYTGTEKQGVKIKIEDLMIRQKCKVNMNDLF